MRQAIRRKFNLKSERGAALVEFALVVPFLMMIMCATIDFGLAVYQLANLQAAVREGGRFAAARFPKPPANDSTVKSVVYNYIAGANNGMSASAKWASITTTAPDAATGNITVRITNYDFKPMTPLASLLGLSTIKMNRASVFRWEGFAGS
jgi:Flp pilus assembly protein TadG